MTINLPIQPLIPIIQAHLLKSHELVLEAAPGAGKTTLVPLALLDEAWCTQRILMLEPRRMAAKAAAAHMAHLRQEPLGQTVGYRVRQESKVSENTRLEVVTGGVLLRLLQDDPSLSAYSAIIFDEFHERSLDSDLGLALTLKSRELFRDQQNPLKIIVMSATLDATPIAELLNNAPKITSEGRSFAVDIHYKPALNRQENSALMVMNALLDALKKHPSDCLVFLPGQKEIMNVQTLLQNYFAECGQKNIRIAPLYGQLSLAEQQAAVLPETDPNLRKIVLATDIAETSLTIEGIQLVVDSGLRRAPVFDANTGLTRLQTLSTSQASATQRAGRAGRLGPGVCYRLWNAQETREAFAKPEIMQADLAPLLLQMMAFGLNSPDELQWLTPPPSAHVNQAIDLLIQLKAVQKAADGWCLTPQGQHMARFPAHPRLAHMMLKGAELGLPKQACWLAAAIEESGRPAQFGVDVEHWHNASRSHPWSLRVKKQAEQFFNLLLLKTKPSDDSDTDPTGLLLAMAYPDRIARKRTNSNTHYLLANGRSAFLEEGHPLTRNTWLVAAEVGGLTHKKDDKIFAAAPLDDIYFKHELSTWVSQEDMIEWSDTRPKWMAERHFKVGSIILKSEPLTDIAPEKRVSILIDYIRSKGLNLLPWEPEHLQWRARIELLRTHSCTEQGLPAWPNVNEDGLLNNLEIWLTPFLTQVTHLNDLRRLNLQTALDTLLPWPLPQKLSEWAPTHIKVPSGSSIAIDYAQNPPVLAVKLQEMFGCEDTPKIARGKVALLIHLLSPAQRPLQVTQDLAGFWRGSYQDVKKDMKGRYPRHPWPDNPLEAPATRLTKAKFLKTNHNDV